MHEVEMEWDYLTPVHEAKNVLEEKGFKTSTMFLSDPEAQQGSRYTRRSLGADYGWR